MTGINDHFLQIQVYICGHQPIAAHPVT
jgi:hypothetical protein